MIANEKELFAFVDRILKPAGLVRKKDTYYLNTPECTAYVVVAKSDYGGQYSIGMGGFLKSLLGKDNDFPPFYKSHLRMDIGLLTDKDNLKQIFDLENHEFIKSERETKIGYVIEKFVLPFLNEISTKEGIIEAIKKYETSQYRLMVMLDLKRALGIPCDD
jgi:hypothetical protein